ncbi:CSEP0488 putative effector protein [Blumeria hordei DH14]|uniref:CSEP0488 putative effector protein n=1 Tax=Blumeria graminis f. sp. hordei (strain DH14) TaxID=546991 RepID=N1JLQ4_BLUG1|nr:CSEP0488 putative effector protein [Blumeria hordei DH14]
MKFLNTVSASALSVLILGSVVQGYVLKCSTGKEFDNQTMDDLASKVEYHYGHDSYPLGPGGEKCQAYEFDSDLPNSQSSSISAYSATDHTHLATATMAYLVQVCSSMEGYRLFEWYNYGWVKCE